MRPDESERAVADTIHRLTLRPEGDVLTGEMPTNIFGPVVFGGFVIAHGVAAATHDAPAGRRLHSLHAYFLRPVLAGKVVTHRVTQLRDGRTLSSRRIESKQEGRQVLTMTCSFANDGDSYEYQPPMPAGVPGPDEVTAEDLGPWRCAVIGPTDPEPDGSRRSTHRMWFRTRAPLGDDPALHAAFLAFATDMTWRGARPLHLDGDTRGIVSLDHAVWFHRPLRADDWTYYDVHSVVNTSGRGLVRGAMYARDGRLCVSVAQETMLTRYEDAAPRAE